MYPVVHTRQFNIEEETNEYVQEDHEFDPHNVNMKILKPLFTRWRHNTIIAKSVAYVSHHSSIKSSDNLWQNYDAELVEQSFEQSANYNRADVGRELESAGLNFDYGDRITLGDWPKVIKIYDFVYGCVTPRYYDQPFSPDMLSVVVSHRT